MEQAVETMFLVTGGMVHLDMGIDILDKDDMEGPVLGRGGEGGRLVG